MLSWIVFNLCIAGLLALDLFLHRKGRVIGIKEATVWSLLWISLALLFDGYLFLSHGKLAGTNFLVGYLIEKSLSIDNLFVFLLIFKYFKTPAQARHKVLFYGVLLAILLRAAFIFLGLELITKFYWVIYLFGLLLLISAVKLWTSHDKSIQPEKNPLLRLFRHLMPVTPHYVGNRFFTRQHARLYATPLCVVLLAIETSDILFAIDSIPAIFAITYDPFIVYTSNIFAIMGLRSLFFVLEHIMGLFRYLHYGLAAILFFIGAKMLLSHLIPIPNLIALAVVALILAISILVSIWNSDSHRPKR